MLQPTQFVFVEPEQWLGDCHPLVEQLDCAGALTPLAPVAAWLRGCPVNSLPALRDFLRRYQAEILLPLELPAIRRAFDHTRRNQLRELLRFDRELARTPMQELFAGPSRRVGRIQLRRLQPLRDVRFVQRYLGAVARNDANAWHTLVYGLTLAVFSLPLRQGLLGYARQTTRGFITAAAWPLHLSEADGWRLFEELADGLIGAVQKLETE